MLGKEEARQEIASLVEKFKRDPKRHAHNEDETRHFYILPLFQALGWDTKSPAEFSAEEQISRGFVDFGFYLNGVPQFYLETKSARQKLDKPENMKQSINYSFLKGVTWAVLSDFEQLMVFNADWEEKDPQRARFLDLNFEHYANGDFDKLWLLSKEAMLSREIDKTAESFGKKAKKEPVTVSLFNDLTEWRRRLFNEIRLQRANLWAEDSRAVDNAVQKFFDRLIFIRTVEDRGIEEKRLVPLLRQAKKQDVIFEKLQALFRELDKVYNSNLFADHELDGMKVYDPDLINEIINGLYKPKGKLLEYDFNAITADILGAVYEQYLGFKAIDPDAKQDTSKSKKRKSQGIYYTPQYVVRYIVQQTLGRLLQEGADPHSLTILDPACGSGSFLIEAFDVLDRWLANKEPDVSAQERRERILKENIFGVDLDEQAIEVTRLNLMLRASFERRKLPYLTNIKHGNSLIESDEIAGKGLGFAWQERFPQVFEKGGFDVVVGNPPYVRQETLGAAFKGYAEEKYQTYAGTADLYVYFMEKGYQVLRENGRMGYIVPNKWLRAGYGQSLREFLKEKIERLIDFGELPVFKEAATFPLIVTLK
jgi:type I restriction-modification system DNA methylase subunit